MDVSPVSKAVTIHLTEGGAVWGILLAHTPEGAIIARDQELTFYPTQQIRRITWDA
jgi:hypothetical protein